MFPRLAFITAVSSLSSLAVQLLERPRPKRRWVSFYYNPLLSSLILIWKVRLAIDFHHLPKAWWTAAWSDNHIFHPGHLADINNRPFPSSLVGITRPCIRPNSCLLSAKLLEALNSFSPYMVVHSVVRQEEEDGSIGWDIGNKPSTERFFVSLSSLRWAVNAETFSSLSFISACSQTIMALKQLLVTLWHSTLGTHTHVTCSSIKLKTPSLDTLSVSM